MKTAAQESSGRAQKVLITDWLKKPPRATVEDCPDSETEDNADSDTDSSLGDGILFDSTRIDWRKDVDMSDDEGEEDELLGEADFGDASFTDALVSLAKSDDPQDLDWVPAQFRRHRALKKGQSSS